MNNFASSEVNERISERMSLGVSVSAATLRATKPHLSARPNAVPRTPRMCLTVFGETPLSKLLIDERLNVLRRQLLQTYPAYCWDHVKPNQLVVSFQRTGPR